MTDNGGADPEIAEEQKPLTNPQGGQIPEITDDYLKELTQRISMITHEQQYNKVSNAIWFILGFAQMVFWMVYSLGTLGSIMFGLIYFPFVLFNIILIASPLKL